MHNLVSMTIVLASTPLLRIKFDECVDSHDSNTRLHSTLELLDFAHSWLQHTRLERVVHFAALQVEAIVLVALGLGNGFCISI